MIIQLGIIIVGLLVWALIVLYREAQDRPESRSDELWRLVTGQTEALTDLEFRVRVLEESLHGRKQEETKAFTDSKGPAPAAAS